jgi:hypothetical protein
MWLKFAICKGHQHFVGDWVHGLKPVLSPIKGAVPWALANQLRRLAGASGQDHVFVRFPRLVSLYWEDVSLGYHRQNNGYCKTF